MVIGLSPEGGAWAGLLAVVAAVQPAAVETHENRPIRRLLQGAAALRRGCGSGPTLSGLPEAAPKPQPSPPPTSRRKPAEPACPPLTAPAC